MASTPTKTMLEADSDKSTPTLTPYRPGQQFPLEILKSCDAWPFAELQDPEITAAISAVYSNTMSPVLDAIVFGIGKFGAKTHFRAVLKVYDRRFGEHLRSDLHQNHRPHTPEHEAAFQSFVKEGKIESFICGREESMRQKKLLPGCGHILDGTENGIAKFEAALWHESKKLFSCEAEAYERLEDLQGKAIPRLYAHVRLTLPKTLVQKELLDEPETAPYFEVYGIILERITGYNLIDMPMSALSPENTKLWPGIVQSAVDAVHEINKRGVLMRDCGPRNVVVDKRSQTPFVVDLAQCDFKDKLIEEWREYGRHEKEGWDPDTEYCDQLRLASNHGEVGVIMTTLLRRSAGLDVVIRYPKYEKVSNGCCGRQNGSGVNDAV
ncbi:hypothetical protein NEMBOFW57_004416 [Staphylotrichum longicolle]|uniref:Protein kinase domain-containing protein n=1 Tax=Staphylotrichum longicolle TaxID=669026 RepID=A0AAD4I5L1_9PEZI|nr:hypothetical protein NEMBOFW57_004416 [Staphylotrichum longicolle]